MCYWQRLISLPASGRILSPVVCVLCQSIAQSILLITVSVQFGNVSWTSHMLCHRQPSLKEGELCDREGKDILQTPIVAEASGQQNGKNSSKLSDGLGLFSLSSHGPVILQDSNYKSFFRKRTCTNPLVQAQCSRFYLLGL